MLPPTTPCASPSTGHGGRKTGLLRLSASAFSTHTGQQSSCHRAMAGLGEVFVTSPGTYGVVFVQTPSFGTSYPHG
jgi:hypothetical protein